MTIRRLLIKILLWPTILIATALSLAVVGTFVPYPLFADDQWAADRNITILVASNTIHTDIAIPIESTSLDVLSFLSGTGLPMDHPEAKWLLVGWGGRSFYLETPTLADIKPGPAFRALTLDKSVIHFDVLGEIPDIHPDILSIKISERAYANLLTAISDTFARDQGAVQPIEGFAFGAVDRFYEAKGYFNAFLGCNTWTARMLRTAGIRTGFWNPIPQSLVLSIRMYNELALGTV